MKPCILGTDRTRPTRHPVAPARASVPVAPRPPARHRGRASRSGRRWIRPRISWRATTIRAGPVTGVMSPNPTVEKTVTVN